MTLNINLSSITISVKNMLEMVNFYNTMFNSNMLPFDAYGSTLYRGNIDGLNIVFCPVEVSGIVALHNTFQLNFVTNNIAEIVNLAIRSGGHQKSELVPANNKMTIVIIDPDGNTLEFLQNLSPVVEPVLTSHNPQTVITEKKVETTIINENNATIPETLQAVLKEHDQPVIYHEIPASSPSNSETILETTDVPEQTEPINNKRMEKITDNLSSVLNQDSVDSNKNNTTEKWSVREDKSESLYNDNQKLEVVNHQEPELQSSVEDFTPHNGSKVLTINQKI